MKQTLILIFLLCICVDARADIVLNTVYQLEPEQMAKKSRKIPKLNSNFCSAITDISALRIPHVREWVFRFKTQNSSYLRLAMKNSVYYRYLTYHHFQKRKEMPIVLSDLPMLESCYDPYAVSHAGAAGLWQFMPGTAKGVGLSMSKWEDQRYSILRSTDAALTHLSYLYERHGSWELALAAYNCGSGRVDAPVKKHPEMSYWELVDNNLLPYETSFYVQKFAALSMLYRHHALFGVERPANDSYAVSRFRLKHPVRIKDIASQSGAPESVLYFLNPHLKRDITPLDQKDYTILIPTQYKNRLANNEKSLYTLKIKRLKEHRVKKGDYLQKIAKRYKVSLESLITINNLKKPYTLYPGKVIYVPVL